MRLKTLAAGVGILAGYIAILANFGNARTQLVELWPTIRAVLPVLALAGAFGAATLIGGCVWRWHVARRPLPPSEHFHQLSVQIRGVVNYFVRDVDSHSIWLDMVTHSARTAEDLATLGVRLPKSEEECTELLLLAEKGQLAEARKRFPHRSETGKPPANK